ncbi:MAG: hypothetical protein DRP46_05955 [Candidatus Zixiibacteriota bacterium]|nr:MAG: hypothetical protein DRP46_05955 [candidate division Zixibacteria bacterium]HDL04637.1 PorV/PorQ family protein [candidate division Zixibacteria bacterium]
MKKICLTAVLLVFLAGSSVRPESGIKMLTAEAGARSVGMGGAFSAVTADPYSAAYNPASTWGITEVTGSFGHNTYWENTRIETGYLSFHKRSTVITAGVQFASIDDLEGRTGPTTDYYEFGAHDVSIKVGAAFELEPKYILGFSIGWMYEKIDVEEGSAFNFDLGLLMQPYPDLNIGLAVLNFGSTVKLIDESYDLPRTYRGGIAYTYHDFTPSADLVYLDDDLYVHLGGEYKLYEKFFIRSGYRIGYDTKDFSAGAGFVRRNFRIDYAYLPYKSGLNDSHLINLTFEI